MNYLDMLRGQSGQTVTVLLANGMRVVGTVATVGGDALRLTEAYYPTDDGAWNANEVRFGEAIVDLTQVLTVNSCNKTEPARELEIQLGADLIALRTELRDRINQLREQLQRETGTELPYVRICSNRALTPLAITVRIDDALHPHQAATTAAALDAACALIRQYFYRTC